MNTEKLIELIEKEEQILTKKLNEENKELEFFENVVTENCYSNSESLLHVDKTNTLIAYLCATSKKLPYKKIERMVNELTSQGNFDLFLPLLDIIVNDAKRLDLPSVRKKVIDILLKKNQNIVDIFNTLHENNGESLEKIFSIIYILEEMKINYNIHSDFIEYMEFSVSDKKKEAAIQDWLQGEYNIKNIMHELSVIPNHYLNIKSKEKNRKKKIKNKLNDYAVLKRKLINWKNKGMNVSEYENIISLISNNDIEREFLYQLNIVQKEEFNKLYKEYCKLSADNKLDIKVLFQQYNLDFNNLILDVKDKVLDYDKNTINEILIYIKTLNIEDYNLINYVLLNSNNEVLKDIDNLVKEGILTYNFVINNINILSVNKQENNNYYKFKQNFQLIKNENINPRLFINYQSIYFSDTTILKNNIQALKQYNLLSSLKTSNTFDLLKNDGLVNKIDILLELGYEENLESNIGLLNNDKNKIKSLYLLKEMNLLPTDLESLTMVLESNIFVAEPENIDSYIFNIVDHRIDKSLMQANQEINFEDDNNLLPRTLVIGDVKLSRNRVRRNQKMLKDSNLDKDDKDIYACVYGSILSEEEYEKVTSSIKGKSKQII